MVIFTPWRHGTLLWPSAIMHGNRDKKRPKRLAESRLPRWGTISPKTNRGTTTSSLDEAFLRRLPNERKSKTIARALLRVEGWLKTTIH